MTTLNNPTVEQDGWRACGGEVRRLVRHLRWRRRSEQASKAAALVLVVLAPISLAYWSTLQLFVTSEIELKVTNVPSCTYYEDEMLAYYSNKSRADLPPQLWEHISHCPDCSKDLIFYGGIAQIKNSERPQQPAHAAHIGHDSQRAVSLIQLLAKGTLAVHR
jgi:hypothetical protein